MRKKPRPRADSGRGKVVMNCFTLIGTSLTKIPLQKWEIHSNIWKRGYGVWTSQVDLIISIPSRVNRSWLKAFVCRGLTSTDLKELRVGWKNFQIWFSFLPARFPVSVRQRQESDSSRRLARKLPKLRKLIASGTEKCPPPKAEEVWVSGNFKLIDNISHTKSWWVMDLLSLIELLSHHSPVLNGRKIVWLKLTTSID